MGNIPKSTLATVQAQVDAVGSAIVVLRDEKIEIRPIGDWPADAYEDLEAGRFKSWSEQCLTDDGLEAWRRIKPTMNELPQFFADYNAATGEDLGK